MAENEVKNWKPGVRTVEKAKLGFEKQEVIEVSLVRGEETVVDCGVRGRLQIVISQVLIRKGIIDADHKKI